MSKILQFKNGNVTWCFSEEEIAKNNGINPFTGQKLVAHLPTGKLITDIISELVQAGYLDVDQVKETGGYQIFSEKPLRSSSGIWFVSGSVPYLLYLRDNLAKIYDFNVNSKNFSDNKYLSPYLVDMIRMNSRVLPQDRVKAALDLEINTHTRHHYKIHLQPKEEYLRDVIFALAKLFSRTNYPITTWKFSINTPTELLQSIPLDTPPSIVVYPFDGEAQNVLNDIKSVTDPNWGSGVKPRGNIRINDLIYYAGGDWDIKKEYPNLFTPDLTLYKEQVPLN